MPVRQPERVEIDLCRLIGDFLPGRQQKAEQVESSANCTSTMQQICAFTANVLTTLPEGRVEELQQKCFDVGADLVGLQECRQQGNWNVAGVF